MDDDGERMLAEALRAKAGQSALPPAEPTLPPLPTPSEGKSDEQTGTLSVGWLLLLVALLGLATGAVIGLLTVL